MIKSKMRKAYLDHYLSLSSMEIREIHRWVLPIAAARLMEWIPTEEKQIYWIISVTSLGSLTPHKINRPKTIRRLSDMDFQLRSVVSYDMVIREKTFI